jgi:hypothetical protein
MDADSKRTKRLWLFGVIATMGLTLGGPTRAYAQQSVAQTLRDTFQLHGYVENQEIIRSENYVSDYHVASIRNRIDLQPSGRINGVPTACWHCINVENTVSNMRFERDDSNLIYYPVREAYLDFRWDFFGANLLRAGKQQACGVRWTFSAFRTSSTRWTSASTFSSSHSRTPEFHSLPSGCSTDLAMFWACRT